VFHTPLDRHDDLPAVLVDDLIVLHGRYTKLADDQQRAAARA
jgi:hypothetical protein